MADTGASEGGATTEEDADAAKAVRRMHGTMDRLDCRMDGLEDAVDDLEAKLMLLALSLGWGDQPSGGASLVNSEVTFGAS